MSKDTTLKPSEKVPYELEGEPTSLYKLVVAEPGWAVARINYSVDRIAELEAQAEKQFNLGFASGMDNILYRLSDELAEAIRKEIDK